MDREDEFLKFREHLEKCTKLEVVVLHNKIYDEVTAFSNELVQEIVNGLSKDAFKYIDCLMYFITAKDILISKMIEEKMDSMASKQPCKEQ